MPKYRGSRIEARIYNKPTASGRAAWYADFRDLGKFGGKLEALKAYGSRMATADREEAILIASRRLKELRELEAATVPYSVDKCQLGALFAAYRTARASERHSPTKQWLRDLDRHGARATRFFGEDFDVTAFTRDHIQDFEGWLEGAPHARGSGFSEGSIHQHLCTLSGMYGWGMRKRLIPGPQNLVNVARRGAKGRIRSPRYRTSDFLDWDEITEMLRFTAAITRSDETPHFHERMATGCYTGVGSLNSDRFPL